MRRATPRGGGSEGARGAGLSPRSLAGLALAALVLAHAGLWLLLTVGARRDLREIDRTWTPSELAAAPNPGPDAPLRPEALAAWKSDRERWEAARRRRERARLRDGLGLALLVSLAAQGAVVARRLGAAGRARAGSERVATR